MVTSVAMEAYAQNDYEYIPMLELYYQEQSGYFYKQKWPEHIGCEIDLDVFLLESDSDGEIDDYSDDYKEYLRFKAQEELKGYKLKLNSPSSSNVILNGTNLLGDKGNFNLNHRDALEIESNLFDLHIHKGLNTCAECEPGLKILTPASSSQIVHLSKSQKEKLRRKELNQLKSQYGLLNAEFTNQPCVSGQKYVDRANIRRKVIGSDHSMTNNCKPIETASLTKPISDKSVGFKMLSKMGWKEGQSLGSKEQNPTALNEPLLPIIRVGMSGLGSENSTVMPNPNNEDVAAKKLKIIKMKQRYDKTKLINCFDDEDT
uniref:G-patch domain-containing protein n=1 Tax=Romanomermis culicivorax TaxID=13658 RepID=A0A915KNJ7_ROMCU